MFIKTRISLLFFILPLISSASEGDSIIRCGTVEHMEFVKARNPGLAEQMIIDEIELQKRISSIKERSPSRDIYTIPVVFHILYNTAAQNISDAQIQSQLDVLNEDYGRTNADASQTPSGFSAEASATEIRFCRAERTPDDHWTTGIERKMTTVTSFTQNDDMKYDSTGGLSAWNVNKYLNIWVCNLSGSLLGYAEYPSSMHTNSFGVVIHTMAFGRTGNLFTHYNRGRTATHEISHCFNLFHIWGDDAGSCSGSDFINDTPNQADNTTNCRTYPATDVCTPGTPGVMFMNYQDYSYDDCLNMFTSQQSLRMIQTLSAFYPTLLTSNGCAETIGIDSPSDFIFSIYPIPSHGILNLDMTASGHTGNLAVITMTDMLGRETLVQQIQNPDGRIHQLETASISDGIYFLNVTSGDYRKTVKLTIAN
jgi:hypothetical protein